MTDTIFDYEGLTGILSVSGGDNVSSGMITDYTLLPDGIKEVLSVSGGDNPGDVSTQPNIYIISLPQEAGPDVLEESAPAEVAYTIWDKPLEEYSVSEGLLLIIVTLAVAAFIWSIVKGGFSWLNW